ncbi:hypothetical protein GDO86_002222 [Hymenochirus boettgeri]|uniref:Calpastatin n=1 Tax=Hymenochirus boettgeri TaxID=247094 RepID=A0A8T2KH19_9PIPI|nr:hypothetical protein GDO86_002222 [Hymenochirus boettgeri]
MASKPGKGRKHSGAGKGPKPQVEKKDTEASKLPDKKLSEGAEKKPGIPSVSKPAGAQASGTSKAPASSGKTMSTADTQPKQTTKTEPAKSTQSTKPKGPVTGPSATTKPSATKPTAAKPPKQDTKAPPAKSKEGSKSKEEKKPVSAEKTSSRASPSKVTPGSASKESAAVAGAGAVVAAGTTAVAASVLAEIKKDEGKEVKNKEEKKSAEIDSALDDLINTLGGPEDIPESPKFTGPEVKDTTVTSEYVEELGKREDTIPPEYRHLLDGKGEKMAEKKEEGKAMSEDDLVDALSSGFETCQASPQIKKPKLEEKQEIKAKSTAVSTEPSIQSKDVKAKSGETSKQATKKKEGKSKSTAVSTQPCTESIPSDALDELLGTLEGPQENIPESPIFTGEEVTENITSTYLEELGKREHTIPPEYRKLLDGKDHGKPQSPSAPVEEVPAMTDAELLDEFSKDFECSSFPVVQETPVVKPKESAQVKQSKPEVVASSASTVKAAGATSASMESALEDLLGTLDDPALSIPQSPVYSGPEITETNVATHIEELGKRESTIPPAYRHLLDGKVDGKVVPPPPPPPEEKPMTENELVDVLSMDFACSESPANQPVPPIQPKVSSEEKPAKADAVVVASSAAAVKAAPTPSKKPAATADPLDALSSTLGVRKEDPNSKKPAVDKVKEVSDKGKKEKLGEDEETIPVDYRLKEVKGKDGKPLLPEPEEKPKPMSEDELLDALTEGFDMSPVGPAKSAPVQSSPKKGPGSEEAISCSKASTIQSVAPQSSAAVVQIPDDALDLLSGSLGEREVDPDENKPIVDVVKEKAKSKHIERLGDRDDTIPPEYRNLLDGKDHVSVSYCS